MDSNEILTMCLNKTGAYIDHPFGDGTIVVKVRKKIFAQLFTLREIPHATFNCSEVMGFTYRARFPGDVRRGYHCPPVQQPYFNTVDLTGGVPDEEIIDMVDHAYDWVVSKLPKYMQRELAEDAGLL